MDHEKLPHPTPDLGMCACDQDMFDRVWKRVMPEETERCPIVVAAPQPAAPCQTGGAVPAQTPAVPAASGTAAQGEIPPSPAESSAAQEQAAELSAPPVEPAPGLLGETAAAAHSDSGDDFPAEDAVPCLGSGSAPHGSQLQTCILFELESWQLYRHLARRVTGSASRTLSALASEKHRHARRLAAAYFLISGVRYWPTDRLATPRFSAWLGTLRTRFTQEQRQESRYRTAACDTSDPCLADLYGELAQGCADQAAVLRLLLESAL